MSHQAFDAAGFVRFDLETGKISSRDDDQMALIPLDLVSHMTPSDGLEAAAQAWGASRAGDIAAHVKADGSAGIELLVDYLGGSLAVAGLGPISVELWGNALLFRVGANLSDTIKTMLTGFLSGFLTALKADAAFQVLHLPDTDEDELFWAGNPTAAGKMRTWVGQGKSAMEALNLLSGKGR